MCVHFLPGYMERSSSNLKYTTFQVTWRLRSFGVSGSLCGISPLEYVERYALWVFQRVFLFLLHGNLCSGSRMIYDGLYDGGFWSELRWCGYFSR